MRVFQSSIILLAAVVVATVAAKKTDDEEWEDFKKTHGKSHNDAKEEAKRKELFLATHRKIAEHNSKSDQTWKMAHNEFSDWTPEERKQLAGKKSSGQRMIESSFDFVADEASSRQLPTSLDWRTDICVGPVKNQGGCGSCWAFSSIAPLEFLLCKNRKAYTSLSEQQLVNCACSGCNGGDYYPAWSYLNKTTTGSIATTSLTYKASKGTCVTFSSGLIKPVSWGRVASSETSIMSALKTYGVLSIAMDVENSFFNYGSGVYSATDCVSTYAYLNHAMAMVGYGTDATGTKYWIIRNSWGTSFGIKGYILVKKGVNMCGVETDVGYVKSNLSAVF